MILAASVLFVVILSATAVSAIDNAGDFVADEFANSTDGADPIDVSDSVDLDNPLDVPDNGDDNETTGEAEVATANAAGGDDNSKIPVGSKPTGNPLVVLLTAIAIVGAGFIRNRK